MPAECPYCYQTLPTAFARLCVHCGGVVPYHRPNQRYCSESCHITSETHTTQAPQTNHTGEEKFA